MRRSARRRVGGASQAMDALRDQRGLPWLDDFARDVRHGLRMLRRSPGFTALALMTFALGIGANTAIFTIVSGVILRPLAYPRPEQLVSLSTETQELSQPEYLQIREAGRSFADVGAYTIREVNLTAGDRPLRVRSATVDGHLLSALGVQPAHGRLFAKGETDVTGPWFPGSSGNMPPPPIAMISNELWHTAFGGRAVVGQTVDVDNRRYEVIGIMPPGVDIMDNGIEIWLPLGLNPANRQQFLGYHFLNVIGRLQDGITVQAAHTELNGVLENWGDGIGDGLGGGLTAHLAGHIQMTPMQDAILGSASRSIWVLQASVGLVLLIACANLAGLLVARAETRHRELAVRAAIGAGRGRLMRQFMTEGVLLSIGGGAAGLWLAAVGVEALLRTYPGALPRAKDISLDLPVLLFTLGVSTAAGLIFGLAPMAHARAKALVTTLKEAATGASGGARHPVRRGLVIGEVALAVMLVAGAGVLVKTAQNLTNVDAGFDRAGLVTFSITSLSPARAQMYQRVLGTLRQVSGVQAATAMSGLPPNRPSDGEDGFVDHYSAPDGDPTPAVDYYQSVMSDYFETMGIPIVEGRSFERADAISPGMVAIVNEQLAHKFWKGQNPIGQRLRPGWAEPWFTVIGVARDVKQAGLDRETGTELYFFVDQMANAPAPLGRSPVTMNVVLRTTLPPSALSRVIEGAVREADSTVAVARLREMDGVFAESIIRPRLLAQLIGTFAGLALLLAGVGTYGVLALSIAARRREIGIRIALGAARSSVLALVMKQGLQLTVAGIILGLAGALGLNRLIASLLFGVQPTDATTLIAVVGTITLVAVAACWLPAWRASRLDPNAVLRAE